MFDLDPALLRTFIAIAETGGLTKAGDRVGRTQPAVSHQLKRLEEMLGKPLFAPDRRRLSLTPDGEILLHYARSILRLIEEARDRFKALNTKGRIILGTPDLYAIYLLPEIISAFSREHPGIEVELRCQRSAPLQIALDAGEVDLALVTRQPYYQGGENVRREQLIWVASADTDIRIEPTLPLAVLPEGSVYRAYALAALARQQRAWRIVSVSDSLTGLQAAVFAGLAASVVPHCTLAPGMRQLGARDGLPKLPAVDLMLLRRSPNLPEAASHFADYLASRLGSVAAFRPARTG